MPTVGPVEGLAGSVRGDNLLPAGAGSWATICFEISGTRSKLTQLRVCPGGQAAKAPALATKLATRATADRRVCIAALPCPDHCRECYTKIEQCRIESKPRPGALSHAAGAEPARLA